MKNYIGCILLSAAMSALFACSSEVSNPPKELQEFDEIVSLEEVWDVSVGDGDEEYQLALEPFVSGQEMFTVDFEGLVEARSIERGKLIWDVELDSRISGGISGDSQQLYVMTFQGELLALDRLSGQINWRADLSSEALSVAVSDGSTVIVHSSDDRVFAFSVDDGAQLWRHDGTAPLLSLRGTATPLIKGNDVIIGFSNGNIGALSLASGSKVWELSLGRSSGRTELERLIDVDGSFGSTFGTIYATAYQGSLKAIDLRGGEELWSVDVPSYTGVAVAAQHEKLVLSTDTSEVVAVDQRSSEVLWRNDDLLYRRLGEVAILGDYAVVSDFEGYLHLLSLKDGTYVGRERPDSDGIMGRMKVVDDRLYVYTRSGCVYAYELKSE